METAFENFRVPVTYILDQELRKRNFKNQINTGSNNYTDLPEFPCKFIRDSVTNKVNSIIYAKDTKLEWSQEFLRDNNDNVFRIRTNFPDSSYEIIEIFKIDNVVSEIKLIERG